MHLPVWRLMLITKGASTLVRVTPLLSAFFLQLLSSFFFCAQHAYHVIIFFCSHDLYSFGYACLRPLGVAVPGEALRVRLIGVHLQPLRCVDSLWLCSALLWSSPCQWTLLIRWISPLEVFKLGEMLYSALSLSLWPHAWDGATRERPT